MFRIVLNNYKKSGQEVVIAVEPLKDRIISNYSYPVIEIPGLSDSNFNVLEAPNGLYSLIKSYQPNIIHVHGYFGLLALGLCEQDIPIVVSIHSTPIWGNRIIGEMGGFEQERIFAEQILNLTKPRVITGANKVYTSAAKKLAPRGVMVKEFPYPILDEFYNKHDSSIFRKRFKLGNKDILFTVPSRIIERKGIRESVNALAKLPQNFYLCLPSAINPLDRSYWDLICNSTEYKSVAKRVIIPDQEILHDQMPFLYSASDLIVMPSYYEGAPVATVEAMASRRPFIGADSQGINYFIRHNQNGILVPQKTSRELATAIFGLAYDKNLQKRLISRAYKDVGELSWKIQLSNLLTLYKEIGE